MILPPFDASRRDESNDIWLDFVRLLDGRLFDFSHFYKNRIKPNRTAGFSVRFLRISALIRTVYNPDQTDLFGALDIGLLEFNRDRLYERYEKWKNKTQAERQNNLNLQGQILALQNNPLNIQQIGMVGYGPPIFYGRPGEDPEDWLRDMQRYIIASRINVAPGAGQAPGREEAFGLVVSCLAGDALNWYNTRVKGKNWRCNNLSDNLGVATLTAVRTLAAGNGGGQIGALNTAGEFQGKAAAEIGRIGAGIATGANIISNGTWDEDWSIAGGEPVDNAPVAPNAGGGLPVVTIAPGIKLGQLLYLFRTAYTTVEHLKQTAVFGQLMQGDMSVEQFSARIKKVGKLAEMTPEQQREQFIRGLNPMNQYNIRMMAKFYDTQDNITKALAEAEKFTLSQKSAPSSLPIFPTANPYADTNRSGGGMTKNEIEDLIKTTMASSQPQTAHQNTDLQSSIKSLQETMSRATKTIDNSKKSANKRGEDLIIRRFLSELLRTKSNKQPENDYNYDPVDDITDSMAGITLNSATINAIKSAVKSAVKKCSKCGRFGHTSRKCSVKKKKKSKKSKKGKVNLTIEPDSSSSSSDTSSSDSSGSDSDTSSSDSSDSDGDLNVHIAKSKKSEEGE
ncbi:unnamed protein product [Rhizophagus irregularis]|nr:unnamed protein product [Rhizophagus irregularis]